MDAIAQPEVAIQRSEISGNGAQQRRLARAVRPDHADPVAAPRLQPPRPDDFLARETSGQFLEIERNVAGARLWFPAVPIEGQAGHALLSGRGNIERLQASSRASCSCIFGNFRWLL